MRSNFYRTLFLGFFSTMICPVLTAEQTDSTSDVKAGVIAKQTESTLDQEIKLFSAIKDHILLESWENDTCILTAESPYKRFELTLDEEQEINKVVEQFYILPEARQNNTCLLTVDVERAILHQVGDLPLQKVLAYNESYIKEQGDSASSLEIERLKNEVRAIVQVLPNPEYTLLN